MKRCYVCKEEKARDMFSRRAKSSDGLNQLCRDCDSKKRKANHEDNREDRLHRMREYYAENRERLRESQKDWHRRNPESHALGGKRYRESHPEKSAERSSRYRARKRNAPRVEKFDRLDILRRDKGICHLCLDPVDPNCWDLDHVHPLALGGDHTADNVRVSHPSCNRSKGATIRQEVKSRC